MYFSPGISVYTLMLVAMLPPAVSASIIAKELNVEVTLDAKHEILSITDNEKFDILYIGVIFFHPSTDFLWRESIVIFHV